MLSQTRRLPLFVALAGLALYLATLGGGVTLNSLPLTARLAGWENLPMASQPLLWLLTLPLRLAPAGWVAPALKLLAAVLASAILGLLARTVQLLPWDRRWENAKRFAVALPVLTACVVCGLEFSFWKEATSACGELLDLLLLATAVWLLLEYNVRRRSVWLDAAALVWGLGMAENWVMLVTLPLFIAGVIWLLRLNFFQMRVIVRLTVLGLAGFSIYLVLPMVNGLAPHSPWTLAQAWLGTLRQTRSAALLPYHFWRAHRLLTIGVAIYFLVPTLPLLVHMRDTGTQNMSGLDRFQVWLYRLLRLGLLLACFWMAFDPITGARQLVQQQAGAWLPLLTLDYVVALGAGFLMGSLLLISQPDAGRDDYYRSRPQFLWKPWVAPAAAVVLSVVVIGLAMRNGPVIWRLNAQPIEQFGERALQSLPAGGGVVLCDFPEKLLVFEAALARRHQTVNWLAVDTHELPKAEYRAELERRQPGAWLTDTTRHELTQLETLRLLAQVAQKHRLFYLHPSYGYFFERFYLEPVGTVFEMKLRGKDPLDVPPLSSAALESNETFWTRVWSQDLARLAPPVSRPNPLEKQLARVGLVPAPQREDRVLADWYSVPLDAWGVALQEQGHLREAQVRFEQALQLNTKNFSARISLACNTNLQAGAKIGVGDIAQVAGELGNPDKLNLMVTADGPFDEATLHYLLGSSYLDHGLLIQAAEQIERVRTLVPGGLAPELALAEIYNRLQMTSRSRPLITHLREAARKLPANSALDLDVAMVDSYSWLLQTNAAQARDVLQAVASEHPDDPKVTGRVLIAYVALRDWTNAVRLVDAQLAKAPDDTQMLNDKAMILMQAGRSADAIALLDHVLLLTNLPAARLNRAFVRLSKENFTLAADDLRELENEGINSPMVSFGLAAVAEHSHDTNQAVHYLQICLTNTPAGGPLWQQANARLQSLKSAAAVK